MAGQDADPLALERIPHITGPVVIATEEDTAGDGKGDGGDAAEDVVVGEGVQFAVCADVEEAAGSIV
jgi:hypothetical protein